ncbi:MAG: NAD(P)H-dependent oxidoreductase [Gammaproteobacteria bacterium]|nr:NAD(P)H-dependent oxidoreductase [Gammaproteobacteria bacterium]
MKKILYVRSSLFGGDGVSNQLSEEFVAKLKARYPGSRVTLLDLAENPLPHLGADEFKAWLVPDNERSKAQQALAAHSDQLIEQLLAHDTLVLAVPMYNFGMPSTLKAWFDRLLRAGKTFRYTEQGPQGLAAGIEAYAFFARGGVYRNTPSDTQTGHLISILSLMGITDVKTVYAEGLNMGDSKKRAGLAEARQSMESLVKDAKEETSYASA